MSFCTQLTQTIYNARCEGADVTQNYCLVTFSLKKVDEIMTVLRKFDMLGKGWYGEGEYDPKKARPDFDIAFSA